MSEALRRSALEQYPDKVPGIRELRCQAIIQINGAAEDLHKHLSECAFKQAVATLRAVSGNDASLLWSAPQQYLLVSENRTAQSLCTILEIQLQAGDATTWVDLTHARTVFELSGPHSRDILAKGCPLDVDALQPGDCAPCLLGHFNVLLHCQGQETFQLFVFRSFALSCMEWLAHAAEEFQT